MTVCGFAKTRDGLGFAWADGEWYRDYEPAGSVEKLVVAGNVVGVGCGYLSLLTEFRRLVGALGRATIESAILSLPAQLRQARDRWRADLISVGLAYNTRTAFALCGVQDGFRGFVLTDATGFSPEERDAWSSPNVNRDVNCAADVLDFAQAQVRFVQAVSPTATGRNLTVARVGPAGVAQTRVPLLLEHERERAA